MTTHIHKTVIVQGLGFVGAAMCAAIAKSGRYKVVGIDLPNSTGQARINAINAGIFPFETTDPLLGEAMAQGHDAGKLSATSDVAIYSKADIIIVDVHLDVDFDTAPPCARYKGFTAAIRTIGERAKAGTLIIIETTVPPGTCEKIVAPLLAECARKRGMADDAFLLAHSYERVMPGRDYLRSITDFWRVYAGHTAAAATACKTFLETIINTADYPLTQLHSTTASETAKVLENSYRATTIAFMEEWGRFAEHVGVDLFAVVDAIRMRPTHSNMRQPGFGVGGYCLTKDPLFAGIAARELFAAPDISFPFSEHAVQTNQQMPLVSLSMLERALGTLHGKTIALLGIAYRPDVADTRYSPSEIFAKAAIAKGATILAHDPLVHHWPEMDIPVSTALPKASTLDAVVFAVGHHDYTTLDITRWLDGASPVILDANHILTDAHYTALKTHGSTVLAIGKGRIL